MTRPVRAFTLVVIAGSLAALCACSPAKTPPPAQASVPAAATAPPPPAARPMKMVCRSSQTGLDVPCGSANAVMVGMKPL
jgi:hypothetical protein